MLGEIRTFEQLGAGRRGSEQGATVDVAMSRYALLPDHIRESLASVEPSTDGLLTYHPCKATLKNGTALDNVYIEPEKPYLREWGIYPEDDRGKQPIRIEDVFHVEDSPMRLPARFANEIYRRGESGMGYTIFTVVFSDGSRQACSTGGAVDFIKYPEGKGPKDVVSVAPHVGRDSNPVSSPRWYWYLYSEIDG